MYCHLQLYAYGYGYLVNFWLILKCNHHENKSPVSAICAQCPEQRMNILLSAF